MNQATIKYTKISAKQAGFTDRTTTLQEDVVAMFAVKSNKRSKSPPDTTPDAKKVKIPPFIRHYKATKDADLESTKLVTQRN